MAVRFRCPCGSILSANEDLVDTIRPCPQCHRNVRIPPAATEKRICVMCRHTIPQSHTIWVRGRRVCWKCMPPGAVHLDLEKHQEHRKHQLESIRRAASQGLHHFQYHTAFASAHSKIQATADEAVFHEKDWDRITPAWREQGLIPFDMGGFMGVGLNVDRFRSLAEDSKKYLEALIELVRLADELPLAAVPKEADAAGARAAPAPPS